MREQFADFKVLAAAIEGNSSPENKQREVL
jgi:hypothetical protein